ncbi:MAG: DUF1476 domain-containing protein [Alphaproteobacteria bacterium]|nr:DUF1476 domain-containing protein [Alphaproteobacteria bacterium]
MTTFEEREKDFEAKFKHDEELRFKVTARRNKLLGLWAAQRMGLAVDAADAYAREVVNAEFDKGGDRHVIEKVCADLAATGASCTPAQLQFELDHFAEQAKQQIMQE